ncbi:hypothetical protein [Streptomyces sp. NPDC052042]|uniref:hypothetical protein n=1 Tax=Streptomyces sp. NPDC052042 TaxID=3365683 RepID=UPI0037CE84E2
MSDYTRNLSENDGTTIPVPVEDIRVLLARRTVQVDPEWERVEQARIHYSYGVNSGTEVTLDTPEAIARAVEDIERRTMGRVNVDKVERRVQITRETPWD